MNCADIPLRKCKYETTPVQRVPEYINFPSYAKTGIVEHSGSTYEIKDGATINKMKKAGKLAAQCLKLCLENSKENTTTDDIDKMAFDFYIKNNAYPAGINFHGFPKTVCASPNEGSAIDFFFFMYYLSIRLLYESRMMLYIQNCDELVCHGIPNLRKLKKGDIITYDCTVFVDGVFGDCAGTTGVGEISEKHKKLINVSKECLYKAISVCRDGQKFSEIGKIITEHAEKNGFKVIRDFCGHFIGKNMHMFPLIEHHYPNGHGDNDRMKKGQIFTIEPILSEGSVNIHTWKDQWTVCTNDNSFCSQWEHTILVLENSAEILTDCE
ncbi:methionine aminopeptidase 1a, putative (METAP1a) [Plasmodium ovale curtisi]|uniref:Methionine aminopeptidase n=1 Tax=Plasmodium ovale curtisi TaxID=864141 RepID=A0A1A8WM30_PLAOA|nr:methionine aminopeptidase 1a, putative (METAP1a) [Plasmodium ovale curtisi]SBS92367.1 methionine aminopeptidase 1a, putative (METAP1a) [Plasmodium ovale curtisi]